MYNSVVFSIFTEVFATITIFIATKYTLYSSHFPFLMILFVEVHFICFFLLWLVLLPCCFCLLFFGACLAACGILVPQPGIEPGPSAVAVWGLNHWTAREFPCCFYLTRKTHKIKALLWNILDHICAYFFVHLFEFSYRIYT